MSQLLFEVECISSKRFLIICRVLNKIELKHESIIQSFIQDLSMYLGDNISFEISFPSENCKSFYATIIINMNEIVGKKRKLPPVPKKLEQFSKQNKYIEIIYLKTYQQLYERCIQDTYNKYIVSINNSSFDITKIY